MMPKYLHWHESNASSAWYGALKAQKATPNVTETNLQEQVHYRPWKRALRTKTAHAGPGIGIPKHSYGWSKARYMCILQRK